MIVRECIYFVNLRQAYLSSPHLANRLSSRTILLTSVPTEYLNEFRLKKLYGNCVRRVWIPRSTKPLFKLVKEREQTAMRLEKAEIALIRSANAIREKGLKKTRKQNKAEQPVNNKRPDPLRRSTVNETRAERQLRLSKRADVKDFSGSPSSSKKALQEDAMNVTQRSVEASAGGEDVIQPVEEESPELKTTEESANLGDTLNRLSSTDHGVRLVALEDDDDFLKMDVQPQIPASSIKEQDQDPEYTHPYGLSSNLPDLRGSVAAIYLPAERRPYHRPIANYLRRVDTIRWTRNRLKELNLQIYKLRKSIRSGKLSATSSLPAAFIEFDTQEAAQAAQQVVAHHRPLRMSTRLLGVKPDEVVWSALRMSWWEMIARRSLVTALIVVAIVFWSIPCALIGVISDIQTLSGIPFLSWLNDLPKPILSLIEGFLPAVALSLWMAAVPVMLRSKCLPRNSQTSSIPHHLANTGDSLGCAGWSSLPGPH